MKSLFNILHFLRKKYWQIFKIETFGVRVLIVDNEKVLLVKHRYGNMWVMPGGGIDKEENPEFAAVREVREETGLEVENLDYKLGFYKNTSGGKNDNVHCFVITKFSPIPNFKRKFIDYIEVADMKWFPIAELKGKVSSATQRRIDEFLAGKKGIIGEW